MTIGFLELVIFIEGSNSLKAKRMFLHSLKARLRNKFNVAVSQVGDEDKWQRSTLAVVGVERDRRSMDSTLNCVLNFVDGCQGIALIDHHIELL